MERNFILAIGIAAAAHGLLLGIPRGAAPVRTPTSVVIADGGDRPDTIEITPAVRGGDEVDVGSAAAGPTEEVNRLPEPVVDDGCKGFLLPIDTSPVAGAINHEATTVPAVRFGAGGDGLGGGTRPVIGVRFLDRTPNAKVRIAPEYPAAARHDGRDGTVTVEFVVDENGRVLEPRVVDSSDHVFEEPALRAVTKWRFEPGTLNHRAVRFRMALPILFRLTHD